MIGLTKKFITALSALVMVVCLAVGIHFILPITAFAEGDDEVKTTLEESDLSITDNVLSGLSSDGKKTLQDASSTANFSLVIPDGVTTVSANAFSGASKITKITIPESVTTIGDLAFSNLTSLNEINFYATECADFSDTPTQNPFFRAGQSNTGSVSLTVNIGKTGGTAVKKLPANMFRGNGANDYIKVASVKFNNVSDNFAIGKWAFAYCNALTSVTIPDKAISIGESAFENCTALSSIGIGTNSELKTIGARAFYGCSALREVVIPASVTTIGSSAYSGCKSLETINYYAVNANATSPLSSSPFGGEKNITVTVGKEGTSITGLPAYLFSNLPITSVNFVNVDFSDATASRANVFAGCAKLSSVEFDSNCKVASIGSNAFSGCTSLKNIDLSGLGLKTIYASAFNGCTALDEINIPEDVTIINAQAFQGCTSLVKVTLPTSLETIGSSAFEDCSSIYQLTIPENVETISTRAFYGCNRLIEVKDESKSLTITKGSTDNGYVGYYALRVYTDGVSYISNNNGYIFYSDSTVAHLIGYSGTATDLQLPEGYDGKEYTVYRGAFLNNTKITSLKITDHVKEIGMVAFSGCTSLTSIELNKLNDIQSNAFENCTSLNKVILPDGISYIRSSLFKGCESLGEINIPSSVKEIEDSAFSGCSSLETVTFNPLFDGNYNLTTIQQNAFKGCANLKVIEIPVSVTALGANVFDGCSKLTTVYMPTNATFNSGVFNGCASALVLIAPSKTSYTSYTNQSNLPTAKLTYIVDVNLVYGDYTVDKPQVKEKLFGLDYRYEQIDKVWTVNVSAGMPVQDGYSLSIWYADADYRSIVNADSFTALLKDLAINSITLYALDVEKPTFVAKNLTYDGTRYTVWDVINSIADKGINDYSEEELTSLQSLFDIEITSYNLVSGAQGEIKEDRLCDAGTYILTISLAGEDGSYPFGIWKTDINLPVIINPAQQSIAEFDWYIRKAGSTSDGASLSPTDVPTKIYINDNDTPYIKIGEDEKEEDYDVRLVLSSYALYAGGVSEVYLEDSDYYTIASYQTAGTPNGAGIYTTQVIISANNNYSFMLDVVGNNGYLGLTLAPNSDRVRYTITKTWYLVQDPDKENKLIADGGGNFNIAGWTYNSIQPNIPKPTLSKADLMSSGATDNLITFSLIMYTNDGEKDITDEKGNKIFNYSKYEDVINASMPAGEYLLTIFVKDYYEGDVLKFNGNSSAGQQFLFTVNYADPVQTFGIGDIDAEISSKFIDLQYNGQVQLASTTAIEILNYDISYVHPSRDGIWSNTAYDSYYTNFEMTYNIEGSGSQYYNEAQYKNKIPSIVPMAPGIYTVYYNITAPSYMPLTTTVNNEDGRKTYFYTLRIYYKLDLPEIGYETYRGDNISAIPFVPTNEYYDIIYLNGTDDASKDASNLFGVDNYTQAGLGHIIALSIRSNCADYIEWADGITGTQISQVTNRIYAPLMFEIKQAENETTTSLSLLPWEWGNYDPDVNKPVWGTKFGSSDDYTFTLTSTLDSNKVYSYNGKDGRLDFSKADAGTYILTAIASEGTNWKEYKITSQLYIFEATVTWEVSPYIASWKYGDYNSSEFTNPEAVLKVKDLDLTFYYCDVSNLLVRYDTLKELEDATGQIPFGDYILVYELEGGTNYGDWSDTVHFSVLKATNYWDVTPAVYDWLYGEYTTRVSAPTAVPHFGVESNVVFSYRQIDTNGAALSGWYDNLDDLLDANGELPVGMYCLRSTLASSNNYESLSTEITFKVSKSVNTWENIPNIIGWSEGRYSSDENAPIAKARFGTVLFTIKNSEGDVIVENVTADEINTSKLKSLDVGSYTLTAYVEGSDNYEAITAVATFAVFEDSVGMTGLIASTMVFAVFAIGLAAAAVVLLILRNKKIDREFRKMVKAELNRR